MRKMLVPLAVLTLVVAAPRAQAPAEKIDLEINAKIRKEGMDNSQIMKTMHYLTDVYGPRLTGSPNHENAAKWAVKQMESWGFKNGHLEPWDFSKIANSDTVREGWLNEKASGHIISPVKDNLVFEVLAWTPSTKGTVTGAGRPTSSRRRGRRPNAELNGVPRDDGAEDERRDCAVGAHDESCRSRKSRRRSGSDDAHDRVPLSGDAAGVPNAPARGAGGRARRTARRRCRRRGARHRRRSDAADGRSRSPRSSTTSLLTSGAAVRVNDAAREHGQIRAFNGTGYDLDEEPADRRAAQRRLRPHHAHPRGRHAGDARVHDRQPARTPTARRRTTRSPKSRAPTRPTKSSCSAATSTRGTRRPAPPTTRSAAR